MKTRWLIPAVLLTLVVVLGRSGADDQDRRAGDRAEQPGGAPANDLLDKLKLSTQQKEKVAQLKKEFEAKQKEAIEKAQAEAKKAREAFDKARKEGDRNALRQASQKLEELNARVRKVQEEFEARFRELLTEEQKKQLDELAARQLAELAPPALLIPGVQQRLGLSAEQKEKIARLRKEFEDRANEVLTAEQRKQLDQLRSGRAGAGRPTERLKGQPERKER